MDYLPTWSPDGSQIAFARWTPRQLYVMVARSDGSGIHRVSALGRRKTSKRGLEDIHWSPDGTRLAYLAYRRPGKYWSEGIYAAAADGSGQRLVAKLPRKPYGFFDLFDWTPDGTRITYAFSRENPDSPFDYGPSDIKTVLTDGTGSSARVVREDWIDDASWLPDGSLLYDRYCRMDDSCQLMLRDSASGLSRPLTDFDQSYGSPGWDYLPFMPRPLSSEVVYTHGLNVYAFSLTANTSRTIHTFPCPHCDPYWEAIDLAGITHDGRFALIESVYTPYSTAAFLLDLDTGAPTPIQLVTADPAEIYLP